MNYVMYVIVIAVASLSALAFVGWAITKGGGRALGFSVPGGGHTPIFV
jgi:hypothetical protein